MVEGGRDAMSCIESASWWERAGRALVRGGGRVALAGVGIVIIVARAFPPVAAVDTEALVLGVGVLVFGVVLPSAAEAEIGLQGFKYKRLLRDRDAEMAAAFPEQQVAALTRFAVRLVGDRTEAARVVEETLVHTYERWHLIRGDQRYFHALCTIVQLGLGAGTLGLLTSRPATDQGAALAALEPRARAMLLLRYYAGLEEHQVAAILDAPLETLRSELIRAEQALQDRMPGPAVDSR